MLRKNAILGGVLIAMLLLFVAIIRYPGGSQNHLDAVGFDWENNYLSNLFETHAINGSDNTSKSWAIGGMFILCLSLGGFFINFSNKLGSKSAANIVKYAGVGAMIFAFLTVTPFHDIMVSISTTLVLINSFYLTVFVLKSKLYFLKFLSVICLLVFYACSYIYFTQNYVDFLPVMQKITLFLYLVWVVSLEYFTQKEDFQHIK